MAPAHDCPIPNACSPLKTVYEASVSDEGSIGYSVLDSDNIDKKENNSTVSVNEGFDLVSNDSEKQKRPSVERKELASPLNSGFKAGEAEWHPPVPYQVWLAPWVDRKGILNSGQYSWFTSKGYWTIEGIKVSHVHENGFESSEEIEFEPTWQGNPKTIGQKGESGNQDKDDLNPLAKASVAVKDWANKQ